MADALRINVKGLSDFQRLIKDAQGDVKQLREPNKKAADIVAKEAASRAPVLTGALQASVRSLASQRSGRVAAGKASVEYAAVIEFGWPGHNLTARPYLYPAIEAKRDDVIEAYGDFMDEVLDKAFPD